MGVESLASATRSNSWSSYSSEINLLAARTGQGTGGIGGPCRLIRIGGDGNLAVRYADGTEELIPSLLAGETLPIIATAIISGTTVTNFTAFL